MTKLEWNRLGERFFQTGVDQGVLFVEGSPVGVPWNGLTSVREGASGGEAVATYIDGVKVNQDTTLEEFVGTIEAYMYPDEFEECQGSSHPNDSLLQVVQQPRKSFAIAYRTRVGNDVMSTDYGYKIHLVFGLTAAPSKRAYKTLDDSVDLDPLAWDVTSVAQAVPGYLATSHLVFDSSKLYQVKLEQLEGIIFGTEEEDSRLPTPAELVDILRWYNPVWIWPNALTVPADNMVANPDPGLGTTAGWGMFGSLTKTEGWLEGNYQGAVYTPYVFTSMADEAIQIGDKVTLSMDYRIDRVDGPATHVTFRPHKRTGNVHYAADRIDVPIILGKEERIVLQWTATAAMDANELDLAMVMAAAGGSFQSVNGFTWRVRRAKIERGHTDGVYYVPGNQRSVYSNLPGYHYHEVLGIRDPRLPGDINEVAPGLFERTETTRLVESVTEGLYRMEA